jgi:holo-[acyl-carrier protein] synthase
MIFGIGTDIIEIDRIRDAVEKYGERFKNRIFTEKEQEYCDSFNDNKYQHYAARFAAKESFSKAIGTGITRGFKFRDVEVCNESNGKPFVTLHGETAEKYGAYLIHISLSHTDKNAVACIVMEI